MAHELGDSEVENYVEAGTYYENTEPISVYRMVHAIFHSSCRTKVSLVCVVASRTCGRCNDSC